MANLAEDYVCFSRDSLAHGIIPTMTKTRIGIFFGGKSAEHEVSIRSAKNVLEAIDLDRFDPVLIGIDRTGEWHHVNSDQLLSSQEPGVISTAPIIERFQGIQTLHLDVAMPILHGPMGEDGTMQGFFELANIPYVGPGVLASAACMDKEYTKRLLRDAGLLIAPFVVLYKDDHYNAADIFAQLGQILFVKPANMGSSVGVNRADSEETLTSAIKTAFEYDTKILIESAITGDEIECAVLGNETPEASAIGRVIPQVDFYSYDAKYVDESGAALEIPANIPGAVVNDAQETALLAYKALGCAGMSRVDMFVQASGEIVINEINTIPGFTSISMYPKLWEISGLPYQDLITKLIELAQERHLVRSQLKTQH